jgi:hypothetical protein
MRASTILATLLVPLVSVPFLTGAVAAEYEDVHRCDEVAAHPNDKQKWGPGVTDESLAPPLVIKFCGEAIRQHPDTPRFHFQLARAYWLAQRYKEAVEHFSIAARKGHAAAHAYLGDAYLSGQGGLPADTARATRSYQAAAEGGFEPAKESLARSQKDIERSTFSLKGFTLPRLIEPLYKGDFSGLNEMDRPYKYQLALYLNEFHKYFEESDYRLIQDTHAQNPAACRLLFDPELDRILLNYMTYENNPLGNTNQEQVQNLLRGFIDMYKGAGTMGMRAFSEPMMNLEVVKKQGTQDAIHLVAAYGCESDITKQIYRNIKPLLLGRQGTVLITDKKAASQLTQGCSGAGYLGGVCSCVVSSVARSEMSSEDQELLAANFSKERIQKMRDKYPAFARYSRACF